jgi:hypothetical protein
MDPGSHPVDEKEIEDIAKWAERAISSEDTRPLVVLTEPRATVTRPLFLAEDGHAYAVTVVAVIGQDGRDERNEVVVVRDDGKLFSGVRMAGLESEDIQALPFHLKVAPHDPRLLWSTNGVKAFVRGERPDPQKLFEKLVRHFDHFVDFGGVAYASHQDMCQVLACAVLGTWLSDAFSVVGYLWFNGTPGSGKTQALSAYIALAYLGQSIVWGGSWASIRDLGALGATQGFDDCESIDESDRSMAEKLEFVRVGYRKGTEATIKVPKGQRGWESVRVPAYAPRAFAATRRPTGALGTRCIIVPMVPSNDPVRSNRDVEDRDSWLYREKELRDELWAFGLSMLAEGRNCWQSLDNEKELFGRRFEVWRWLLATAGLLERHGVAGLTAVVRRVMCAAEGWHREQGVELTRDAVVVLALDRLLGARGGVLPLAFRAAELKEYVRGVQDEAGETPFNLDDGDVEKRLGRSLKVLGLRPQKGPGGSRQWLLTADLWERLKGRYVVPPAGMPGVGGSGVCGVLGISGVLGVCGISGITDTSTSLNSKKTPADANSINAQNATNATNATPPASPVPPPNSPPETPGPQSGPTGGRPEEELALDRWLEEETVAEERAGTPTAALYESYRAWCQRNGIEAVAGEEF